MTLTQKELDAIEHWWKPHSPAHPFLAQEVATPDIVINHLLELVKELKESRAAFIEAGEILAGENVGYKEALDDIGSATREWIERNGAHRLVERANMALAGEKTLSRLNGEGE